MYWFWWVEGWRIAEVSKEGWSGEKCKQKNRRLDKGFHPKVIKGGAHAPDPWTTQ
ncbi:UNVERIFIED_CONTAM: hypothetical protein FKN15_067237 [Acipenser sinensis]